MIYFKGDASADDIEYVPRAADGKDFSQPIRVNSEPESAVAIGTVRGPQIALGRNGRVYVIWFGSRERSGNAPDRSEEHTSELQSRLHLVCRLLLEKKNTYVKCICTAS